MPGDCTALSVAKGFVTEPLLTLEIGGEVFLFMVDTGAMVLLIQPGISRAQMHPCDVEARGITGTQLYVKGEQKIEFVIRNQDEYMTFVHTFIVSPLKRCSSGILGMYFLQQVGAEISLTTQSLNIGSHTFPLRGRERGVSPVRRLITAGSEGSLSLDQEERENGPVGDWEGTEELAEAVTIPPLSVRIARCRVVRRADSAIVKVPRNQEVLVDPEGLPGVYLARVVATLDSNVSSMNASGSPPYMVNSKSSLVQHMFSPRDKVNKFVASCNGCSLVTKHDGSSLKVGTGECLLELPEGGLPVATTVPRDDLQAKSSSLPVENIFGTQVDIHQINTAQVKRKDDNKGQRTKKRILLLGYVPIQIANLSLEEINLEKQNYIRVASPIHVNDTQKCKEMFRILW